MRRPADVIPLGERGFTLVELLAAVAIIGVLLTLSATAFRNYWLAQSLAGSQGEIVSQMRLAQQRAEAESHPVVYGLRFEDNSRQWSLLQYDPRLPSGGNCHEVELVDFQGGVVVQSATFASAGDITATCKSDLINQGKTGVLEDNMVFFFPRGSATAGTVHIRSTSLGKTLEVEVEGVTGRAVPK